jgi:hypothetical protein
MKTARFLFKMIGCVLLLYGIGHAAPDTKHVGQKHSHSAPSNATSATAKNAHQPDSRGLVSFLHPAIAGNHAAAVRPTSILRTAGPSLKQARHQGGNPAIIGGPAHSSRSTAAINGTGMSRRR